MANQVQILDKAISILLSTHAPLGEAYASNSRADWAFLTRVW